MGAKMNPLYLTVGISRTHERRFFLLTDWKIPSKLRLLKMQEQVYVVFLQKKTPRRLTSSNLI